MHQQAMKSRRMFVIGLDCAPPELVFGKFRAKLTNLDRLMRRGVYGRLRSCVPCITIPAWSVMTSSRDPGVLGIYGIRNRADHSYQRMSIATGAAVREPRVWDLLGVAGKQVITIGVPGTYPARTVNGAQIGCFLTPASAARGETTGATSNNFTYPPELSKRVNAWAGGEYLVDVKQFRTDDKSFLLKQIYQVTQQHFRVVQEMMRHQYWDFFMFVEMGTDRIHHGFWHYLDPTHPKHQPGDQFENAIADYYIHIDTEIGSLLAQLDENTSVIVVSDHGAKSMQGGICVNEWLIRNGWLVLKGEHPTRPIPFEGAAVDWSQTRAWGEGGYYARISLNVKGREPHGLIEPSDYESTRSELAKSLTEICGPNGETLGTRVFKPQEIYSEVNGVAPDLIVYWGDLRWRSIGTVGHADTWTKDNDTGPDEANHAEDGIFIYHDPRFDLGGRELHNLQIMDFGPTVLKYFGMPTPRDWQGTALAVIAEDPE